MKKAAICACATLILIILTIQSAPAADAPEQVYEKFLQALRAGNFDKMVTYTCKAQQEKLKEYTEDEKKQMFKMLQECAPAEYEITKKEVNEADAFLWLEGMHKNPFTFEKEKGYAKIHLVNEAGEWKIEKETWRPEPIE